MVPIDFVKAVIGLRREKNHDPRRSPPIKGRSISSCHTIKKIVAVKESAIMNIKEFNELLHPK